MAKRTAVIDIGSNSIRMAIFQRSSRWAFHTLKDHKIKIRLIEGSYEKEKTIKAEIIQKTIKAFSEFKNIIKDYKCSKTLLVGTSALRDANNAKELISIIKKEFGFNIKIISGEKEAFYGAIAAKNLLKMPKRAVSLDIGGGSSEIALIENQEIIQCISLDLGVVRLKELFNDKDKMKKHIKQILTLIPNNFKNEYLIAIGGSLRAISNAIMKKTNYPLNSIHGFKYEIKHTKDFINTLAEGKNLENSGIKKDRIDTISQGASIFLEIIKHLEVEYIITSGVGIREGVFLSNFLRPSIKLPSNTNIGIKNLQDRFNISDNKFIYQYCIELFKKLSPLHKITNDFELKVAAKLCNIGQSISFYEHHIHSAYIILNALNFGFTHKQKATIACIIATNGKKNIYEKNKFYNLLPNEDKIYWFSAILALSKALNIDKQNVKLNFIFSNNNLQIIGLKQTQMIKDEIKKIYIPDNFIISFAN